MRQSDFHRLAEMKENYPEEDGDCPKPKEDSCATNVCGVPRPHGYGRKRRPCEFRFRILPSPRHQHLRPKYAQPATDRKSENHYHKPDGFECGHAPIFSSSAFRISSLSIHLMAGGARCGSQTEPTPEVSHSFTTKASRTALNVPNFLNCLLRALRLRGEVASLRVVIAPWCFPN